MDEEKQQKLSPQGKLIRLKNLRDIPKGAIILNERAVVGIQRKIISQWQPQKEVWSLTYGKYVSGGYAFMMACICNNYFRSRFSLQHFGRTGSYGMVVGLSTALTVFLHEFLIDRPLLTGKFTCAVCAELRSGVLQVVSGAVYPTVLAIPLSIIKAREHFTHSVPKITHINQVPGIAKIVIPQPFLRIFVLIVASQLFIGVALAKWKLKTFNTVLMRGDEISQEEFAQEAAMTS